MVGVLCLPLEHLALVTVWDRWWARYSIYLPQYCGAYAPISLVGLSPVISFQLVICPGQNFSTICHLKCLQPQLLKIKLFEWNKCLEMSCLSWSVSLCYLSGDGRVCRRKGSMKWGGRRGPWWSLTRALVLPLLPSPCWGYRNEHLYHAGDVYHKTPR